MQYFKIYSIKYPNNFSLEIGQKLEENGFEGLGDKQNTKFENLVAAKIRKTCQLVNYCVPKGLHPEYNRDKICRSKKQRRYLCPH